MLFCGIRDTNVTPVQYTSCAQRLLSLLVAKGQCLEQQCRFVSV